MFLLFGPQPSGQALLLSLSLWQRQREGKGARMAVILLKEN